MLGKKKEQIAHIPHLYSPSKGTRLSLRNIALPESDLIMVTHKFADPASWQPEDCGSMKLNRIRDIYKLPVLCHKNATLMDQILHVGR